MPIVTFECTGCGATVSRNLKRSDQPTHFCCRECYLAWRDRDGDSRHRRSGAKPAPKAKKCEHVKIAVVRKLDLFPGFVPEVGRVYDAEKYKDAHYSMPGYVIVVNGHRVNVRYNECEEVEV